MYHAVLHDAFIVWGFDSGGTALGPGAIHGPKPQGQTPRGGARDGERRRLGVKVKGI